MAIDPLRYLRNAVRVGASQQWQGLVAATDRLSFGRLRALQDEARHLRRTADRFLAQSQRRLDGAARAADVPHLPSGTDWRWRPSFLSARISPPGIADPENGTGLGDEAAIWHDCPHRAVILRQMPNRSATDLAPYGLQLESMGFTGSYLSASVDLPDEALAGLTRSHIVRLDATLQVERPISIYARLNVGHGPNTDELLRHLGDFAPGATETRVIEFDLYYMPMNEKRLHKIWLDLIFESPAMNSVRIRDLFLSRHQRAEV